MRLPNDQGWRQDRSIAAILHRIMFGVFSYALTASAPAGSRAPKRDTYWCWPPPPVAPDRSRLLLDVTGLAKLSCFDDISLEAAINFERPS